MIEIKEKKKDGSSEMIEIGEEWIEDKKPVEKIVTSEKWTN